MHSRGGSNYGFPNSNKNPNFGKTNYRMDCKGIKKTFFKYILPAYAFIPVLLCPQVSKAQQLFIKINPVFDNRSLVLDDQNYITANGDTVSIETFKFYLSNFILVTEDAERAGEKNSYHLVDAQDSTSFYFAVNNIRPWVYKRLQFDIGVDSLANVSGAMSGALDPIHGMYWAWNTGYINAKLVGHSRPCKTLHHQFDFHIGGYTNPYNSLRKVVLELDDLPISSSGTTVIELNADISQWFKGPQIINLFRTNDIVIPGKSAMMMADNYMDMFSIKKQP